MKKTWVDNVAVEAIAHQGVSKLYTQIADTIGEFRAAGDLTDDGMAKLGLAAKIEEATGISVKFQIMPSPFINAAVRIPSLDKNHPLVANIYRLYATNEDLDNVKKFSGNKLIGTVDKKDSRVYGGFSKLVCPVYLTTGIINNEKYTNKEIAAVILHELGHVFAYFERLIDLVTVNYAISTATERLLKLESNVDRIEVLAELDKYAGVNVPDKETIARSDNKGTIYTHLSCEVMKQRRNEEGNEVYSYRGFEFSADQFATRHGAGPELVAALDKMNRAMWLNPSYMPWPLHIMVELVKITSHVIIITSAAMVGNPFAILGFIGIMLASRPMDKLYDDPAERYARIEREMVSELKNRQLDDGRREQILDDLRVVRDISKDVVDKAGYWETVWKYVIPSGKESRKRMEFQQSLERMANNDLYVASALFA